MANTELMVLSQNEKLQFLTERDGMWERVGTTDLLQVNQARNEAQESISEVTGQVFGALAMGAGAGDPHDVLKSIGVDLYTAVVPDALQDAFAQNIVTIAGGQTVDRLVVLADDEVDWIPWEIFCANTAEDYFGLRFEIARMPFVGKRRLHGARTARYKVRHVCNLLATDTLDSTQEAVWAQTFGAIHSGPNWEMRIPDGRGGPAPEPLGLTHLSDLAEPDIVHITCNAQLDGDASRWDLDPRARGPAYQRWFKVRQVLALPPATASRHPLVFGNACGHIGGAAHPGRASATTCSQFGIRFLELGASAYIGTFAQVSPTAAVTFACRFYQELLIAQKCVGRALLDTKRFFGSSGAPNLADDPSWLFYCLYGRPDVTFLL